MLATLTLLVGAIRLAAALLGGAQLVRFLPESVLVGFTAGAGILIAGMQLDEALGLSGVRAHGLVSELTAVGSGVSAIGWPALAMSVATAALVLLGRSLSPRVPVALLCVVTGTAAAAAFGLGQAMGLPLVGERALVPTGWPPGAWPSLDPALLSGLLVPASAIVLLGTLELAVTARAGGERANMKREITAQGWANVAAALSAGFPASASLTRSALLRTGGGPAPVSPRLRPRSSRCRSCSSPAASWATSRRRAWPACCSPPRGACSTATRCAGCGARPRKRACCCC